MSAKRAHFERTSHGTGAALHILLGTLALTLFATTRGEDWPQFRGPSRDSVWKERGVLQSFPPEGLKVRWRTALGVGLSSPVVAHGCVYVTDAEVEKPRAWERVQCFEEKTGKPLWMYRDPADNPDAYDPKSPSGPCPTPAVQEGRVFTLGATGHLLCLDARKGSVIWQRILAEDYSLIESPNFTSCPLIEGGLLLIVVGGKPGACVVAFDKRSGREVWRALDDPPRAFSSPIVISAGGKRQLIVWTPKAVTSLDPATGHILWREELVTREDYAVATPVYQDGLLLISGLMFQLDRHKPAATLLWPESKALSLRVLSHTCMPMILGDYVFGAKIGGHLVCLDARTGKQVWDSDKAVTPGHGATIHLTLNGDSVLLFTDQGDLVRTRLNGEGYHEISRTHLIEPDFQFGDRKVVWAPLAFASKRVFARNFHELVCASLAAVK